MIWKLFRRRKKRYLNSKIPIFGVQAAGKTYFIHSLAYFISRRGLGSVVGDHSRDYMYRLKPALLRGEPLDATSGFRDIELQIDQVYFQDFEEVMTETHLRQYLPESFQDEDEDVPEEEEKGSETVSCNLVLSTNDLSGLQFTQAMMRLSEPSANLGGDARTKPFLKVLNACQGAIAVIDIVRKNITAEEFKQDRKELIRQNLAEQVIPLLRGVELALRNRKNSKQIFPLFLIFTKRDVHQLDRQELTEIVWEIFPILLARYKNQIWVRIHSVQNIGFGQNMDPDAYLQSHSQGLGMFLADLNYSFKKVIK